jgi:D-lactate dehydrogenase
VADRLWGWSDHSRLPVVVDASSCTLGLVREIVPHLDDARRARHEAITILDSTSWLARHLLPHLHVLRTAETTVVHATCSMAHLEVQDDLVAAAGAASLQVVVPTAMTCCAFAGDRGLLRPELTASATAREAEEVRAIGAAAHVCANRTCEIGLEQATGQPYESVVMLLEWATRPDRADP